MATGTSASGLLQQLRQLGDIRRDPPRLIFREQFGRRASAGLILEIDAREFLPGSGPLR